MSSAPKGFLRAALGAFGGVPVFVYAPEHDDSFARKDHFARLRIARGFAKLFKDAGVTTAIVHRITPHIGRYCQPGGKRGVFVAALN